MHIFRLDSVLGAVLGIAFSAATWSATAPNKVTDAIHKIFLVDGRNPY